MTPFAGILNGSFASPFLHRSDTHAVRFCYHGLHSVNYATIVNAR
jgi:hypothetical protein